MSEFYSEQNGTPAPYSDNNSYSYYDAPSAEPENKPKKPKSSHTVLKVLAFALSLVIVGAGSVQVYKFFDDSKIQVTEEDESVVVPAPAKEIAAAVKEGTLPSSPPAQNLPSLFDIAARTDAKQLPDIVDEIMPSVVGVSSTFEINEPYTTWGWGGFQSETRKRQAVGTGTGIVMTDDGYIVTNAHVVYDEEYNAGEAVDVYVLFSDQSKHDAKIIAYDTETDIAVLKIDATGLTPATFGNSDELRVGELVIAVGNPLGFDLFGSVTSGIVSALNRQIAINEKHMTLIQTDAAINSGNSGGPLLNSCGQVIGINSAKMSSSYGSASVEGLGFAIPINEAKNIVDELIYNGYVTGRPQIGISGEDVSESYSAYRGIPMGVIVRAVSEGSAAEEAGIKPGDVIIAIENEAITTMDELNTIKNKYKAGDTITLKISRDGADIDVRITLQDANADKAGKKSSTEPAESDD
ncbi:MAG: trypsin-like peptidase domain-containing protein [Ruminococcus sp.]|nr:trypsin-like peptidase domain-containing protein [Ruminococcus sp.]